MAYVTFRPLTSNESHTFLTKSGFTLIENAVEGYSSYLCGFLNLKIPCDIIIKNIDDLYSMIYQHGYNNGLNEGKNESIRNIMTNLTKIILK